MILSIDIETYCDLDLRKVGVYRYAEHPSFEILMMAYAFDDEPVQVVDLTHEVMPNKVRTSLSDTSITKSAFNANFERVCLASHFSHEMPPEQWSCTMVQASELGLPRSLEKAAEVLGVTEKMSEGKNLIRYFSKLAKPSSVNEYGTRNRPKHAPDKWATYLEYCKRDVEVERAIREKLSHLPVHSSEIELWRVDQRIVDRGVPLDMPFVRECLKMNKAVTDEMMGEMGRITGLDNPNSLNQLKEWLQPRTDGVDVFEVGVTKDTLELIAEAGTEAVSRVMELRSQLGKSSTSKYSKMEEAVCEDSRARGLLQFYGAQRTGRWAGRLIQVQNLPRNYIDTLSEARRMVADGSTESVRAFYGDVSDTLSQLIRTAFVPSDGRRFIVSDFSAIEARVIAWLAGEEWRMEVFRTHGKIYEASASQMFGVPLESIDKGNPLRAQGKVAELACGFGGSVGAISKMDFNNDIPEEDYRRIVDQWRAKSPRIVDLWYGLERAAIDTVRTGSPHTYRRISFYLRSGFLFMRLPSGRSLAYPAPKLKPGKFGNDQIHFKEYAYGKWRESDTYGGKLAENATQAVARDLLAHAIIRLEEEGHEVVMHIHDEVVIDSPPETTLDEINEIMGSGPDWSKGLPLTADGYECDFYMKD